MTVSLDDGRAFVVKQVSAAARNLGRSLGPELYAYRVASWCAPFANVLPRAVHLDERAELLAIVASPADHLLAWHVRQPGFPHPHFAAAVARALTTMHDATDSIPVPINASCGILWLPDTSPAKRDLGSDSPAAAAVADTIAGNDLLTNDFRHTRDMLQPQCLVHGDVKWDNIAVDPGPPARAVLFDLELSGFGDPAWDVGSVLADTLALRAWADGEAPGGRLLTRSLRAFLGAYDATCMGDTDFADRVAGCWSARSAHLAIEAAAAVGNAAHPAVVGLLDTASRIAAAHGSVATEIAASLTCASTAVADG